ncbi:type IV pilus biogenesis protein PilP [Klebsiella aerogenes]
MHALNTSLVAVLLACVTLPAMAQTDAPPPAAAGTGFTIAQLEQIQAQTLILEAKAQRAKAELAARDGGDDGGLPVSRAPAGATSAAAGTGNALPRIAEISGSGNTLRARLVMPDGAMLQATQGQSIAGTDLTITRVTAQSVQARHANGTTLSLPMVE